MRCQPDNQCGQATALLGTALRDMKGALQRPTDLTADDGDQPCGRREEREIEGEIQLDPWSRRCFNFAVISTTNAPFPQAPGELVWSHSGDVVRRLVTIALPSNIERLMPKKQLLTVLACV